MYKATTGVVRVEVETSEQFIVKVRLRKGRDEGGVGFSLWR